jgi:hypothetical protein
MLDDLRKSAARSYEEEIIEEQRPRPPRRILGMTAPQRFFVALMILLATCVVGAVVLIAAGKVVF